MSLLPLLRSKNTHLIESYWCMYFSTCNLDGFHCDTFCCDSNNLFRSDSSFHCWKLVSPFLAFVQLAWNKENSHLFWTTDKHLNYLPSKLLWKLYLASFYIFYMYAYVFTDYWCLWLEYSLAHWHVYFSQIHLLKLLKFPCRGEFP